MPDPIEELENFTIPGTTMNPLPAAEVRRRGTRMRRRNNALAVAGAVAVVAVVATPFAVAASHDSSSDGHLQPADGSSSPAPVSWRQTIPAGFDITALPDGAGYRFTERGDGEPVVDDITLCGTPAFSARSGDPVGPAVDTLGASWGEPGTEGAAARTLALYGDDAAASAALDALRQAVASCPREEQPGNGLPLVNDVVDTQVAGAEESLVYTNQAKDGDLLSDLTAVEVARVGNALFLGTSGTSAGGPQAAGTVDNLVAGSAPVVDQLCTFSADGCADPSATESPAADAGGLAGTIPDDFPLEKGLPTDRPQGAVGLEGPSRDLDLAVYNLDNVLQACGVAPTGLPEATDTLYAGYRSPAEGILRQLMTFASVDDAQAYADGLMAPFRGCPEDTDQQGVRKVYEVTPGPLGDDSAASVMRMEVGGRPGPGYQVVQVVRVGQAVLQTVVVNDGERLDAERQASYLENSQTVVEAMS